MLKKVDGHKVEVPARPPFAVYMPDEYAGMLEDGSFEQLGLETEIVHAPQAEEAKKDETPKA
jgi:hypothetical protein